MTGARRIVALRSLWRAVRAGRGAGSPSLGERVRAIPALVRDTASGRYPGMSRAKLAAFALAVAYVLSPVDLVPELIVPLLGYGDDAVVALGLAGSLLVETERYLRFKRQPEVVEG